MKQGVIVLLLFISVTLISQEVYESERDDEQREPWTVGVALSGGAALGLAHVGVLKVLEEEGIPISYISGTSMGSIVAGMYAAGYSAKDMDSILTTVEWSAMFSERIPQKRMTLARREEGERNLVELTHRWFVPRIPTGVVSLQNVEILLTDLLAEAAYDANYDFDSLDIPFRCVAAEVTTGEKVVFDSGSMVDAIRASIAIPAVFEPAYVEGRTLIDGGAVQNLPVEPLLEFSPDFIIASDVIRWTDEARSIIDVVHRSMAIVTEPNRQHQRKLASVVIYPNVDRFLPSDFARAKELVAAGERTARTALPAIKQKIGDHPLVLELHPRYPRPLVVVRDVRIEGLHVTRDRVVRRQILTSSSDTLDFTRLVRDLEILRETGLFRHVTHRLEFTGSTVDVIYTVQEKDYGVYGFNFYYDNIYDFAVRFEVAQGNILGTGARLGASAILGEPNDFRMGLAGSRLAWLPFTYRMEAYRNSTLHFFYDPADQNRWPYHARTWGADIDLGYALGKKAYFTLGYVYRNHRNDLPSFVQASDTAERVTGPTFKLRYSTLDDLSFPTRGMDFTLDAKLGVENEFMPRTFVKAGLGTSTYFPFGDRVVLGTGLGYGVGLDSLPRAELFRLGGTNPYGFAEEAFQTTEYLGLRVLLGVNLFELFGSDRYPVRAELVTDILVINPLLSIPADGLENNSFVGAGMGVAANTPVGPIRVSVGISADRSPRFRISIGVPPRERM